MGSRNGLDKAQLGTLDSLKLPHRGAVNVIWFDRPTTPGMLHKVRHVITDRRHRGNDSSHRERTAHATSSKPRANNAGPEARVQTANTSGRAVTKEKSLSSGEGGLLSPPDTYEASGGTSLLLRAQAGGGLLRVEVQRDGFVLVWPTLLSAQAFVDTIRARVSLPQDGVATYIARDGDPTSVPFAAVEDADNQPLRFLRIDLGPRSFLWSSRYSDLRRAGYVKESVDDRTHEVSFSDEHFDSDLVRALIGDTSSFAPSEVRDAMLGQAEDKLRSYA